MDYQIEFNISNGLWWPIWEARQQIHYEYHTKHLKDADVFTSLCPKRDLIFQAGGNVGIWPNHFSKFFKTVITAEPDPDLFQCLDRNRFENVKIIEAAIGNSCEDINFYRTGKSGTGGMKETGAAPIKVKQCTIDSLNIEPDAIYLDIEGYEETAILGALDTIKKCRPMICLETFDSTREAVNDLMGSLGYKMVKRRGRDQTYAPR